MNAAILSARNLAIAEGGKRRETPVIWHYTEEHFLTVVDWMLAGISYKKVRELCSTDLQLPPAKIDSVSTLSRFWEEYSRYYLIANRRQSARLATELTSEAEAQPDRFDVPTLAAMKQLTFEMLSVPGADPKNVQAMMGLFLKSRDQDLKLQTIAQQERKLALLEAKEASAKETLGDSKLTPAQREERMREIFGMA